MAGFAYLVLVTADEASADTGGFDVVQPATESQAGRDDLLGGVLAPVEAVIGSAGEVTLPVLEPVAQTAATIVEPVANAAEPVVAQALRATEPVLEPVVRPVVDVAEPLVEVVAPIVEPVTAPIVDAARPVTEPIADAGADRVISRIDGSRESAEQTGPPAQERGFPVLDPPAGALPEPGVSPLWNHQAGTADLSRPAVSSPSSVWTSENADVREGEKRVPPPGPSGPATGIPGVATTSTTASGGAHQADHAVSASSPAVELRQVLGRSPPDSGTRPQLNGFDDRDHPS